MTGAERNELVEKWSQKANADWQAEVGPTGAASKDFKECIESNISDIESLGYEIVKKPPQAAAGGKWRWLTPDELVARWERHQAFGVDEIKIINSPDSTAS